MYKLEFQSYKRIGQYLRRWLGWSMLCAAAAVSAAPGDPDVNYGNCAITFDSNINQYRFVWPFTGFPNGNLANGEGFLITNSFSGMIATFSDSPSPLFRYSTFSSVPPVLGANTPTDSSQVAFEPLPMAPPGQTIYLSVGAGPDNEVCTYSYTLTIEGLAYTRSNVQVYERQPAVQSATPASIPTLSQWGLMLLTGLLGLFIFHRSARARR